jgi:hypothetical protein
MKPISPTYAFCLRFLDVDVSKPDEKSIMTYLAQFSRRFPDLVRGVRGQQFAYLKELSRLAARVHQCRAWRTATMARGFSRAIDGRTGRAQRRHSTGVQSKAASLSRVPRDRSPGEGGMDENAPN